MQDVIIDFAQSADLDALVELLGELFAQEEDFQPDPEKQRRGLSLILDNPDRGRLFALRVKGRVAGMASGLITVSTAEGATVMILEDVIVAPVHRGQGLGHRLLEHVIAWAAGAGMARITLLTDAHNYRAQATYGRMGFVGSEMKVMRRIIPMEQGGNTVFLASLG